MAQPDFENETNRNSRSTFDKVSFHGWTSRSGTREYYPAFALVGQYKRKISLLSETVLLATQTTWRVSSPVFFMFSKRCTINIVLSILSTACLFSNDIYFTLLLAYLLNQCMTLASTHST